MVYFPALRKWFDKVDNLNHSSNSEFNIFVIFNKQLINTENEINTKQDTLTDTDLDRSVGKKDQLWCLNMFDGAKP